jgi:hypothetical protein
MNRRAIFLAEQLLESVPKDEINDLVVLLQYYNRFNEGDRPIAMRNGSNLPANPQLEEEVKGEMARFLKSASQYTYVTSGQSVCRCCGK